MRKQPKDLQTLHPDQRGLVNGGRFSGPHQEAAKAYFLQCIDAATYERLRRKAGWDGHPYVAARLFLSSDEWKKYLWIGKHGSLYGFTDRFGDE